MARSRNIKPSIMENEDLAELEPVARLLFIYLWMLADRDGRLEDRPKRIAGRALPYDRHVNVDAVLNQLAATGFITRYAVGDQAVIHITNFAKHQSPHVRESKSELPEIRESIIKAMPKHNLGSAEASPRSPDSLFPLPDSLVNPLVVSELTPCPHQEIISLYAELLPELPQIRKWEGTRPKHLKARWGWVLKDLESKGKLFDKSAGVDFFRRMFEYISTRDFLMGRTGVWTASLPWIVEDENFTKIIEGNYMNKEEAEA